MDENALMPQGAAPAGPAPAPQAVPQAEPNAHGAPPLYAQYQKLQAAESMLSTVRTGLEALASLGDTVTPEDVVREAGLLVAHGLDPVQMAGMLSDMPEGGELLVGWIQGHLVDVSNREAQLAPVMNSVRQELGVQAMHGLVEHHFANTGEPS